MQRYLFIVLVSFAIIACKKHIDVSSGRNEVAALQQSLKDSLNSADYAALDFSRMARTVINGRSLIRVAFMGKRMGEEFVLVEVDVNGKIKLGRIVQIQLLDKLNGEIIIKNLHGKNIESSIIINGYRRNKVSSRVIEPDPYVELPEVVVTSYTRRGEISQASWYNLLLLLNSTDTGGSWTGTYTEANPYSGGGGSGSSGTTGGTTGGSMDPSTPGGMIDTEILEIDFESQYDEPAIELDKFLKCFSNIPDAGATCRITIFADVPVDDDPTKIMNWESGSPGHTWLRLEKVNGSQRVSQHIGFYPNSRWKSSLTDVPIEGKWVDNSLHEFNAYYELTITPASLQLAITHILYLQRFIQYDIDDYNCTDWAIDVWRKAVSPTLWFDIPRFQMPGSLNPNGTATPQGVFEKLKLLQQSGTPGITIPVIGFAGASDGPCN